MNTSKYEGLVILTGRISPPQSSGLEEPVEYRIPLAIQIDREPAGARTQLHCEQYKGPPPVCGSEESRSIMRRLGPVVGYESEDGTMALSAWMGETMTVSAKFDVAPLPPMIYMRQHMVEVVGIDQERPAGAIKVICFAQSEA